MAVNKGDRKESKVEFDNAYDKIFDDCVRLGGNWFGASEEQKQELGSFLQMMIERTLRVASDIGTYIRMANSIYPICRKEYEERRTCQEKAIGLCFDLMTKYQDIMKRLHIKDDKYVVEIKNIQHEINCLKKWRTSDNSRFKDLG